MSPSYMTLVNTNLRPWAFGLVFMAAPLVGQSDVAGHLKHLGRTWDEALVKKDRATLERILADDFLFTGPTGRVGTKQQMIENILSPDLVMDPFQAEDVKVRIYGTTAILTGSVAQKGTLRGRPFHYTARYTDVYAKRKGSWKVVNAQVTIISSLVSVLPSSTK